MTRSESPPAAFPDCVIEVTPDKKVVWTFKDFEHFGDAFAVGRILD